MNIGNITSNGMNLNIVGKDMQIEVYEKVIKNLQQKVEQLEKENKILRENAEHNDKVVDDMRWKNLQLENIRKEAIKYVQEKADYPISYYHCLKDLLNILNKGSEDNG